MPFADVHVTIHSCDCLVQCQFHIRYDDPNPSTTLTPTPYVIGFPLFLWPTILPSLKHSVPLFPRTFIMVTV